MEDDPAYEIAIVRVSPPVEGTPVTNASLREAIQATLRRHSASSAWISVVLVDDAQMAELNRRHLDRRGPTDVLAFDLGDGGDEHGADPKGPPHPGLEGEIVISVETAVREARRRGHGADAEAALYAVHGMLHLLGYDDRRDQDAARMHEVEDEILSALGMGPVFQAKRR